MNPLTSMVEQAKQQGVIVRTYCSWCPNESTGELQMIDGDLEINLPVCEECVKVIASRHQQKMEGLEQLSDG